ncbi:VOC family protein [Streptomyces sp. NPDC007991]|uniref:VOC family protein n=1 Tax=Streptomyces sp. NPDC007991 TaxID=3364803 RepID=UPI0036E54D34
MLNPTIRHITFDCTGQPYELARFWSELLGRPISDADKPGDPEVLIELPNGAPEEVERAVSLGARVLTDRTLPNGRGWVVMADPEGNEFCVERGSAIRSSESE